MSRFLCERIQAACNGSDVSIKEEKKGFRGVFEIRIHLPRQARGAEARLLLITVLGDLQSISIYHSTLYGSGQERLNPHV